MVKASSFANPNCRHAVSALNVLDTQLLPQITPQRLLRNISTIPSLSLEPPTSLKSPVEAWDAEVREMETAVIVFERNQCTIDVHVACMYM